MAYDIGPRIGIEGEKQFRQAIQQINTNLRTLSTEMMAVTSKYDKNDKSTEALTEKNMVLNKQIEEQKKKLEELKKGLDMASEKYGENDKVTQGWQQAVNKATAELNNMERELEENNKVLKENETASDNSKEGLEELGESADKSGGKFEKLGGILKASAAAMGAVAVAAGAAAIKLGKEVINQFAELEQNLGGSEAVFGKYAENIQKIGEDAYKNMGVSQSEYLATANKMGALFQGSGISQQKSLELTTKAMQRAADMASVMGIDMQMALDSVAGAAKGNFTMMDNLGVAMNATTIEAYALSKGLEFTWNTATQAEKAEIAMQMFFEKTEQYAGNFARESTETISGSIGLFKAAIQSFVGGLGNANADMNKLTQNVIDAFQAVVKNVVPIIKNLTSAIPQAVGAILPALGELLPDLLTIATDLFQQVLNTVMSMLPELIPVAVQALMTITGTLIENLPLLINSAITLILTLANGIAQALPDLVPTIVDTMITIVETLIDNIDMLIDAAIAIIMGLAEGIINALPRLLDKLPVIIDKLVIAITNNLPKIIEMGIKLTIKLAEGLIKAIPNLLAAIPQIMISIIKGFANYFGNMADVGANLIKGLWNGINDVTGWIINKIKGFGNKVIKSIKGIFGIHSPSRVMRDEVGKNLALGIGEGFTSQMKKVTSEMNDVLPTRFDVDSTINGTLDNALTGVQGINGTTEFVFNLSIPLDGKELVRRTIRFTSEELAKLNRNSKLALGGV